LTSYAYAYPKTDALAGVGSPMNEVVCLYVNIELC
jgi:hypothetical protein